MIKKFKLQKEDCVNGNDFIHENCQSDAARQYEMFSQYFGVQDLLTVPPPHAQCPNTKSMSFSTGSTLFGRKPGIWGLLSPLMNKPVQCRANHSTRLAVGSTGTLVMEYKPMQLPMMGTLLILLQK